MKRKAPILLGAAAIAGAGMLGGLFLANGPMSVSLLNAGGSNQRTLEFSNAKNDYPNEGAGTFNAVTDLGNSILMRGSGSVGASDDGFILYSGGGSIALGYDSSLFVSHITSIEIQFGAISGDALASAAIMEMNGEDVNPVGEFDEVAIVTGDKKTLVPSSDYATSEANCFFMINVGPSDYTQEISVVLTSITVSYTCGD